MLFIYFGVSVQFRVFRYHEHIVEDDIPECTTIKEFKCETKTRGYTTEEVR